MYSRNIYGRRYDKRTDEVVPPPDYGGNAWTDTEAKPAFGVDAGEAAARPAMNEMAEGDGFAVRMNEPAAPEEPKEADEGPGGVLRIAEGLKKRRFDKEDLALAALLLALLGADGADGTTLLLILALL